MNEDGSRSRYVSCLTGAQLHRLAYREWGDPANPRVVVCVHGLTRNSRDFGPLGRALSDRWRVIAADMPGRGASVACRPALDRRLRRGGVFPEGSGGRIVGWSGSEDEPRFLPDHPTSRLSRARSAGAASDAARGGGW